MDDAQVREQIAVLTTRMKAWDDAGMAFLSLVQQIDKRDPRLTANMRQYGILPQLSKFFGLQGDMLTVLTPLLKELEARVQPDQ